MNELSRKFNELLEKEVESRAKNNGSDTYYESHYLMEELSGLGREDNKVVLDGKPVNPVHSDGGPNSDTHNWLIVVEWDGVLFMTDQYFDSYDLQDLGLFRQCESYVEPVTKYRVVR